MVKVSPGVFHQFFVEHGNQNVFPYNKLQATRSSFRGVKWVLTKTKVDNSVMKENHQHTIAIPTTSFDTDTVMALIVEKQVYPVPPVMDDIVDCLYCWGRRKDLSWHHLALNWLLFRLENGFECSQKKLLRDCIEYKIRMEIRNDLGLVDGATMSSLIAQWYFWYDHQFFFGGARDFYLLTIGSVAFVKEIINEQTILPAWVDAIDPTVCNAPTVSP